MGMFDDLIPQKPAAAAAPAAAAGGMFDDLIPKQAPAEPNADFSATRSVTQGATGFNEGLASSVLRPIDAARRLGVPDAVLSAAGPLGTIPRLINKGIDAALPSFESAFREHFVDPAGAPQNRGEQLLRASTRMVGENLPLMATGAGAANAGLRSGVTMAEQAAPGIVNKIRGAADTVLEGIAAHPVASAVGENAGAAAAGAGGNIGRNIAKDAGGDESWQQASEIAGQMVGGPGAALYSKVAPTALAGKAVKWAGEKVLDNLPHGAVPEQLRPAGSYAERKADQLAYSNREGKYEDPNVPPPAAPNFATRRMDAGQAKREDKAAAAASKEFNGIIAQPEAAANLAEAQRLEQAVPGFKPGVAKATQDPALLKLQDSMESRATGDELRGVQQAHDSNVAAIRTAKENIGQPRGTNWDRNTTGSNWTPPEGNVVIDVPTAALNQHLAENPKMHVTAPKPEVADYAKSGGLMSVADAAVAGGRINLTNGRNRVAAAAANGEKTVPLSVPAGDADTVNAILKTGRPEAPPQDLVAAANSKRVGAAQDRVEQQAAGVKGKIQGVSDSLPEVDPTVTGNVLRDTRASLKGEADAKMKELRAGVDPEGKAVVTLKGDKPENDVKMSVNQALDRRAQINQDLADHYGATNRDAAANRDIRRLQAEKATLDDAIGASSEGGAPGLKAYNDYYRDEYAPRFLQGASREVGRFNRNGYEGNRVAVEDVPTKLLGPNSISEARQVNKLYGDNPEVKQQIIDHHLDDLRRTGIDPVTGQLKEGAVTKYLAKNERLFNEMPWVREAISAKNPDELYKRLGQLEQRQRAVADTKVAGLLNKNPEQHIDAALNDWQVMKGLRNSVRGDPQAESALRRAVLARAPDPMNVEKFQSFLSGNDRALRQVLEPDHLKALNDVLAAAKINNQLPRPKGTVDLPGSFADKGAKVFGITIPSLLQRALSVQQGRMSVGYGVADVATRAVRQFSNAEIESAWKEALYNPKVAKDLQLMVKGGGATPIQLARMRNYMLSVGAHDDEQNIDPKKGWRLY